jgi:hypothetical protein
LEIPFYHTYCTRTQRLNRFADPNGEEVLHLKPGEVQFKRHIARQFPSQNIWSVLLWYEAWQVARIKPVELAKSERMRLQTCRDFKTPNLPARLRAKVLASPSWSRWLKAVDNAEIELEPSLIKG